MKTVAITKMADALDVTPPSYETPGAAGADIRACLPQHQIRQGVTLKPGERALLPTGFAIALPEGYEAQIRPRSGLAFRYGLTVANAPGTIDSDYRGEVKILLVNLGEEAVTIRHGDRIAQMVIAPVEQVRFAFGAIDDTERGAGGFGSTGAS